MEIFRHLSVLVLDEDPLFCVLTEETLRLLEFRDICTACRSAAAASILENQRPAIMLVNVDESREEIWTTLAKPRHRSTLVVATSFRRGACDRIDAIRQGADAFLPKPYSKAQLLRTMSHLLASEAGRRCKIVSLPRRDQQALRVSAHRSCSNSPADPGGIDRL